MSEVIKKATLYNSGFWILTGIAAALLILSFFTPPMWVIDGSVIKAVGELFAFAALWTVNHAISKGIDAKLKHNDTELTLTNDNPSNQK